MRFMRIFITIVILSVLMIDWSAKAYSKVLLENIITMTVDGFEEKGAWVIKFSRFRAKNWRGDQKGEREPSNNWIKWLEASDNPPYLREELLPDGVQKNTTLKESEKTILAIRGKWDFPGYNWFVLEPNNIRPAKDLLKKWLRLVAKSEKDEYRPKRLEWKKGIHPNFIWMTGKIKQMLIYVWGGNFNYSMETHFQDYKGNEFVLPVTKLNFKGWRNIKVVIPNAIRQSQHMTPNTQPLKFMSFKVISDPYADPTEFYMYLDYFHAITDTYEPSYFGEELQFVENYWGDAAATGGGNNK